MPNPVPSQSSCVVCGADWTWFRWEDDDEPPCDCDLNPPKPSAELSWMREDLKKAGEQIKRHEAGL